MYTILLNNDNKLVTSVRERIMQRSKLVDNLHFLVDPAYKELDMSSVGEEGFIIKTVGNNIVIAGKTQRGTLYGVYSFLEKFLGYRCFTKDVEKIEKMDNLTLDEISVVETPDFEYREAYFRFAFDPDFAVKNKLNANLASIPLERGGHTKFYNFHHSFDDDFRIHFVSSVRM